MSDADALLLLVRAAVVARRRARTDLEDAVTAARAAGVTWADLGDALGMTRQGAHRLYGDLPAPSERTS